MPGDDESGDPVSNRSMIPACCTRGKQVTGAAVAGVPLRNQ